MLTTRHFNQSIIPFILSKALLTVVQFAIRHNPAWRGGREQLPHAHLAGLTIKKWR
jgi:hypothetical protein